MCGVGVGDVQMYSGNSLQRDCIELYRPIGISDVQVREINAWGSILTDLL